MSGNPTVVIEAISDFIHTTDAINYLEAIAIGYVLADTSERARLFKALPPSKWQGLMAGIAQAIEKGDKEAVRLAICKTFSIASDRRVTSAMTLVYDALKQAEANAAAAFREINHPRQADVETRRLEEPMYRIEIEFDGKWYPLADGYESEDWALMALSEWKQRNQYIGDKFWKLVAYEPAKPVDEIPY